jgi:hypothetical protein
MMNPWDRPPIPNRGNRSDRVLFEAIGRTLNAWEQVEAASAHLYSALLAGNPFDLSANRAYGEPTSFVQRSAGLQRAAQTYFTARPRQDLEAEFDRLVKLAIGYSARRNDIAHGLARFIHWVLEPASPEGLLTAPTLQWCLVPPHFRKDKFTANNAPLYVLTSWEINEFGHVFWDIARGIANLSYWVLPPRRTLRGIHPLPDVVPYSVRVPRIRKESKPQHKPSQM